MTGYDWLDEYCLGFKGAHKDYKTEWSWTRYMVECKLFLALCDADQTCGEELITLKCEPSEGEFLRGQYPGAIIPGYYMDHRTWISIKPSGGVPDELIKELALKAYRLVFEKLPKYKQRELESK